MIPQATKHFQWAFHVSSLVDAIPRVEKEFCLGVCFRPHGTPDSVMNNRTESMQDGEVQGREEDGLQRSLADVLPRSRYIFPCRSGSPWQLIWTGPVCSPASTPRTPFSNLGKQPNADPARASRALGEHPAPCGEGPIRLV
jgi:hypothetical protein